VVSGLNQLNLIIFSQLDMILGAQCRLTNDDESHDEHLFIITHQAFELWFKQILYEIESILTIFDGKMCEKQSRVVMNRLTRVTAILKLMVGQFEILETMGCVDFASFRSAFRGASGFQSTQFRILENRIGIEHASRCCTFLSRFEDTLTDDQKEKIRVSKEQPNLVKRVTAWLERTPGRDVFYEILKNTIKKEVNNLLDTAEHEDDEDEKNFYKQSAQSMRERYDILFDVERYEAQCAKGSNCLPHGAMIGAMMIHSYADEPRFAVPSSILKSLLDMDALFVKWRFSHAMMVKRMIGTKLGTGGSGGYQYLRSTVSDRFMPFNGLFDVSSYVLPQRSMPALDQDLLKKLHSYECDCCSGLPSTRHSYC